MGKPPLVHVAKIITDINTRVKLLRETEGVNGKMQISADINISLCDVKERKHKT